MKRTNQYLYDTDDVAQIPQEVIDERLSLLDKHLSKLLDVDMFERDTERVAAVLKAQDHWRDMQNGTNN